MSETEDKIQFVFDASNYDTDMILESYMFIFTQWMGGAITAEEVKKMVPTVDIFFQFLDCFREVYLSRPDSNLAEFQKREKKVVDTLTDAMNLSESQLKHIWEELAIQVEQYQRRLRLTRKLD